MNLFCCFQKKIPIKAINVKVKDIETINVLVTDERVTELSMVSNYTYEDLFCDTEDTDKKIIEDILYLMVFKIEYKPGFHSV